MDVERWEGSLDAIRPPIVSSRQAYTTMLTFVDKNYK